MNRMLKLQLSERDCIKKLKKLDRFDFFNFLNLWLFNLINSDLFEWGLSPYYGTNFS